jgi:hypothetical protein
MNWIIPAYWTGMKTAVNRMQMKTTNAPICPARRGGQAA